MKAKGFAAYQKTNVTTAKRGDVLLMLYEGCIKFVRLAREKMIANKVSEKGKYISKALAIISELINTLDHEKGGQLSADLESLYMFIMDKLIEANCSNKVEDLDAVEKILKTLQTAWEDVVKNPRADGVPSQKLQPELYDHYQQVSQSAGQEAAAAAIHSTIENSAAKVSLSQKTQEKKD